jgi:replicative DNA helicase
MTDSARTDLGPLPGRAALYSLEAEEAVLGSVLINPEAYFEIAHVLRPDDFHLHKHRWIWDAFVHLHDQRLPVDLITVAEELQRRNQLDEAGGTAYLTHLINTVPTSLHAEAYAHIVRRSALRRRLLDAASHIAKLAYEEDRDVGEVVNEAEATVFAVGAQRLSKDLTPINEAISAYYDRVQFLIEHRGEQLGVPTGFYDLDKVLGGMQKSDLLIIAGRPGSGKSGFMISAAKNAAQTHKKHVAIFSLEMSNEQLVQRLIAQETGIDAQRLRMGELRDDELPLFAQAVNVLSEIPIFLDDTPALTPLQLRAKCRRLDQEYGLDLVIVDYLQLMQGEGRSENRVQEVSYISRSLKTLARELNVPVLAGAQLSRAVEQRTGKRPQLSDLRESGCLTGDSLVTLADSGAEVPLRGLAGQSGFRIWALNPQTLKLEAMPVSRVFSTGVKAVHQLTTRLGRTIRATTNHQFLTIRGWRRLDELHVGDYLATPRFLSNASQQSMTKAELALLGHLIGDGCTLPTHAMQYTTHEKDLADRVASLARQVFGDEVNPRIVYERRWYQVYLASTPQHTHRVHSAVTDWLRSLGIWGLRSHEKFVPDRVFQQPPSAIAHFLRHLWATDGSIQVVKGKKTRPIAHYASSSAILAKNVQSLLLRLGINARLQRISQNGKGRDQYHVTVTGKPDLEKFAGSIGAVGEYRQRRLAEVIAHLQEHPANTKRDIIPHDIWRMYVVPAMAKTGLSARQMQAAIGTHYCGTGLYQQNVSRERATRVARVVNSDELATLADSGVYWDRIDAIEPDAAEEVFDLTVPGYHNFVVNNLIAHNSLEQDSDIVMFIYREDEEDAERSGRSLDEVHLLVAKHRNGPTGDVMLLFQRALAKFENAVTYTRDLQDV